ncbi:penicillin-binding protein activator LpoB [Aliivibrio finisterrensis]|uniref:Penicillin-binding protein activator LpoB n=1 Tax=Aliivibrio finisterrensis TaxID=511998 RepID=A0A4V1Z895_9GAMM|nr:penicillin-binding protein activator LpoB [Aliivibrio finisterrensis]RYU55036.1 penicillin-binding protein activator LpoB [Aliivibrio finisterrensis]RYU56628.1 penicillin-binding protein activator LpoB [Aliivibrio finisterrensis]RYU61749.1 penicillin-binding protein activator LpoB [Aliivibrio finisterrensis]RYU66946.1 penicillin-binding protein activator LpoB [Aliivibrio finisterrensis]
MVGCQSTSLKVNSEADIESNSQIEKVSRDALFESENIELPSNYDVKAFNKMSIAAYVDHVRFEKDAKTTQIDNGIIAKLLENELARTKRYEVLTRNCDACDYEVAFQAENTVEEGTIQRGEQLNPEYVFETSIALGTVIKKMSDHNEIIFRSLVTTKVVDPTSGKIIHSFEPIRHNMPAKRFFAMEGKFLGGFDYRNHNELQEAYKEAAQKAIQVLVNRTMDYYPVGGRVTNFRNGRFAIDAGIDQGFATKQPVVLFLSDDGLDIPIASGEVTPKTNGGSGVMFIWKEDDLDADDVKKKLEAMGKDYLKRNKIYAVSVGTPEDWKL